MLSTIEKDFLESSIKLFRYYKSLGEKAIEQLEMANQLIGVTMQEQGVSRVVAVDVDEALRMREEVAA